MGICDGAACVGTASDGAARDRPGPVRRLVCALLIACLVGGGAALAAKPSGAVGNASVHVPHVSSRVAARVSKQVDRAGLAVGNAAFIRIFKQERRLELFLRAADGTYRMFRSYRVCAVSGALGPKQVRGDEQAPEGFYGLTAERLNPWSKYHLSLNLGYPNRLDRALGRTGSNLMIHGDCVSEGCFAMTDPGIEQVYYLVAAALARGQAEVPVHIFPFVPTPENFDPHLLSPWFDFWWNLKEGYELFERNRKPPDVFVDISDLVYRFTP